jgi:hypothetical protein
MNRRHLVAAELLKLRTTRTSVGVGIAGVLLAVLVGLGNVGAAGQGTSPPAGSAAFVENVVGVSTLPAVVALLLGVLLAAGEYQHGTITTTFLAPPRRLRVLGAKAIAGAGSRPLWAAATLVLAWTAVVAAVAVPLVERRDVS